MKVISVHRTEIYLAMSIVPIHRIVLVLGPYKPLLANASPHQWSPSSSSSPSVQVRRLTSRPSFPHLNNAFFTFQ